MAAYDIITTDEVWLLPISPASFTCAANLTSIILHFFVIPDRWIGGFTNSSLSEYFPTYDKLLKEHL